MNGSVITDREAIHLAVAGNVDAWHELMRRYRPLVYKLMYGMPLYSYRSEVESMLWEEFVKAIHSYDPDRQVPPAGWIASCLRYAMWNRFKRWKKDWQHEVYPEEMAETPDDVQIEKQVCTLDMVTRLRHALTSLSPKQQAVIRALYWEEKKIADVAHAWSCSPQAVSRIHRRALGMLKKRLAGTNSCPKKG